MSESILWQTLRRSPVALVLSLTVHLVLLLILIVGISYNMTPTAPPSKKVDTMEAVVVDAGAVRAEAEKIKRAEEKKKQEEAERKRQAEEELEQARQQREKEEQRLADVQRQQEENAKAEKVRQQKLEKERKEKQQELAKLEKQKKEEQQRLAEMAEKRKTEEEAEKKRKAEEAAEAQRKQEEAELQRRLAEEEQKRAANNSRLQNLRNQYMLQIQQHISRHWLQPAQMAANWQCEIKVQQDALGEIQSVQVLSCNGSDAFRSSVEQAVRKSSPLPLPREPDVFEKNIRFIFKPKI